MKDEEHSGRFFVLEGTNASGKATQFELLVSRLANAGYDVVTFDFPQYEQESSFFVREYLRGKFGSAHEVGPYTGSLFYALDRYSVRRDIENALKQGKIVLANRFTGSNMAHQATYFSKPEERRGFYVWLDDLEHRMLKVPRPTRNFILRVDSSTALKLLKKRAEETGKELDMHEKDSAHLKRAVTVYDELGILFPKDFTRIDCVRGGDMLEPEHIHELLWQTMQEDLPEPAKQKGTRVQGKVAVEQNIVETSTRKAQQVSLLDAVRLRLPIISEGQVPILQTLRPEQRDRNGNYAYYIPEGLSEKAKSAYTSTMNQLFGVYSRLYDQLKKTLPETDARAALQGIIPVSILVPVDANQPITQAKPNLVFNQLAETMLPSMHAKLDDPLKLIAYTPRNEFDLIPYMLYEQSNLSLIDLNSAIETWTYEEKEKIFTSYLTSESNKPALSHANYQFDIVADLSLLLELLNSTISTQYIQDLTPRFGYTIPEIVIDKGVAGSYDKCFGASINLYTSLLEVGQRQMSQYTVLIGHKQRFIARLNASDINKDGDRERNHSNAVSQLKLQLVELIKEKHPLTVG